MPEAISPERRFRAPPDGRRTKNLKFEANISELDWSIILRLFTNTVIYDLVIELHDNSNSPVDVTKNLKRVGQIYKFNKVFLSNGLPYRFAKVGSFPSIQFNLISIQEQQNTETSN